MWEAMENAVQRVRQPHLNALRALGVSHRAIARLGMHQPPFGVMNGTIADTGLFVPGDGPACVVQPVIIGSQIIDIVAWRTMQPDRWHLMTGLGWIMGEDQLYTAPGVPVTLHATPLEWLASGGKGSCILDWSAMELTILRSLDAIEVANAELGKMLAHSRSVGIGGSFQVVAALETVAQRGYRDDAAHCAHERKGVSFSLELFSFLGRVLYHRAHDGNNPLSLCLFGHGCTCARAVNSSWSSWLVINLTASSSATPANLPGSRNVAHAKRNRTQKPARR